jgi:hypothetical protein
MIAEVEAAQEAIAYKALRPDLMSPAERLDEIAEILAAGHPAGPRAAARSRGQHRGAGSRRLLAQAKRSCRSLWSTETEQVTDSIAAQVAALPKKPTPELKQMWRELFVSVTRQFNTTTSMGRLTLSRNRGNGDIRGSSGRFPAGSGRVGHRSGTTALSQEPP